MGLLFLFFFPFTSILPLPVDAGPYITVTLLLVITVILYLDFMRVHFQPLGGGCPFTFANYFARLKFAQTW